MGRRICLPSPKYSSPLFVLVFCLYIDVPFHDAALRQKLSSLSQKATCCSLMNSKEATQGTFFSYHIKCGRLKRRKMDRHRLLLAHSRQ